MTGMQFDVKAVDYEQLLSQYAQQILALQIETTALKRAILEQAAKAAEQEQVDAGAGE